MSIAGDLVSFLVSLVQEVGVTAGVGALTITLIGHLLALHSRVPETTLAYVRAARRVRLVALVLIIASGLCAVLIHLQTGTSGVLMVPAFVFKWGLIILLTAYHFIDRRATGVAQDAIEGFEGANWYALLIVHTIAPVVAWGLLLEVYAGWIVTFAVIWGGFVWFMRWQSTHKAHSAGAPPAPSSPLAGRGAVSAPAPPAPASSVPAPFVSSLPSVTVMPKGPGDIQ
jgi:hypothetical protein